MLTNCQKLSFDGMNMKVEQVCYWIVWVGSVFYSLWKFIQSSQDHYYELNPDDFENGWELLHRKKDNSDIEWAILTTTFKRYWLLIVVQIFCAQIILRAKYKFPQDLSNALPMFYAPYSLLCLMMIVGSKASFIFILYVTFLFIVHITGKKILCYALTVLALLLLHTPYFISVKASFLLGETESFLFEVALAWLMAKTLSFAVDRIDSGTNRYMAVLDFASIISYCFYLPTVFTGPILSYDHFIEQVMKTEQPLPLKTFSWRVLHLIYRLSWYFIFDLLLHFVYSSAAQYYPDVASSFDSWSLCGLGYALPMMFYLKYFVIYGVAGSIARLETLNLPPPPKCISSIHLSSYLWRHFDRGLYLWILRYLYQPLINGNWSVIRKVYALAFSFAFVCLWHGMDKPICMWSSLNFTLVASEMIVKIFLSTDHGKQFKKFSGVSRKRLCGIFATPHFIMMCISCTFFLSNWDIGILLFERVMFSGLQPLLPLAVIMYCGCRVSMDVREWETHRHVSFKDLVFKSKFRK